MRAINLIPDDARVGGGRGGAGRSGGAVYAVLGGLGVLVVMVAVWAMTGSTIDDQRADLARIDLETAQVKAKAGALGEPGAVQQLRVTRTETVRTLAAQRHDWAKTLDAISRTLPADTTLSGLDATGVGGTTAPATPGTAAGPTMSIEGCAPSQRAVARLMPRLRSVPDVVDVTLVSSSVKAQAEAVGTAEPSACSGARFTMDLVLEGAPIAGVAPTGTATPAAATTAPVATTPPAPSTATTAVPGTPDPATGVTQ